MNETTLSLGEVSYEEMFHNCQTTMGIEQTNPSHNGTNISMEHECKKQRQLTP